MYEEIEDITINNLFQFEFGCVYEYIGIKYDEEEDRIIRRRIKRRRIKQYNNSIYAYAFRAYNIEEDKKAKKNKAIYIQCSTAQQCRSESA